MARGTKTEKPGQASLLPPPSKPPLTAELLRKMLWEEFDGEDWGDIDSSWFDPDNDDPEPEAQQLTELLARVVARIQKETT